MRRIGSNFLKKKKKKKYRSSKNTQRNGSAKLETLTRFINVWNKRERSRGSHGYTLPRVISRLIRISSLIIPFRKRGQVLFMENGGTVLLSLSLSLSFSLSVFLHLIGLDANIRGKYCFAGMSHRVRWSAGSCRKGGGKGVVTIRRRWERQTDGNAK